MIFNRNTGTGAAGVHDGHMIPADLTLDILPVLLTQLICIAAGDLPLAGEDKVYQKGIGNDQVRQEQIRLFPAASPDIVGVSLLERSDIGNIHPVRWMIVGHGHSLKGSDGFRRKNLFFRPVDWHGPRTGQAQFLRQVFLAAGPGNRNIQAKQISLRLPARNILG